MIPLRLKIRNFLSYREDVPALDFTGIHVACLCGENGHGKSALLDAITWSVWGKARGQSIDDLVAYGADEARVELEFAARGVPYRVIRSRQRPGGHRRQGRSDLQLQALNESGSHRNISGNSIMETQAQIQRLVGMDYDTFINSAFLLQGRADEFTGKRPSERKVILASILGLEAYDRYREQASQKYSEKHGEVNQLTGSLEQLQRDLADLGDPAAELAEVRSRLNSLDAQLAQAREEAEAARQAVDQVRSLIAELEGDRSLLAQAEQNTVHLTSSLSSAEARIKDIKELAEQADAIEAGLQRLEQAQRSYDALNLARQESEPLRQLVNQLTNDIKMERVRQENEAAQLRRRIEQEWSPQAQGEPWLLQERLAVEQELEGLAEAQGEIDADRSRLQVLAAAIGERATTAQRYETEGRQLKEKLELLNHTDPSATTCPLCNTRLDVAGCRALAENYQREIAEKREQFRENRQQQQALDAEKAALERDLDRRQQALNQKGNRLRERLTLLGRQLEEARRAAEAIEEAQPRLAVAVAALESGQFALTERQKLSGAETRLLELAYDEQAMQQAYREVQQYQSFPDRQRQLNQALERLPVEEREREASAAALLRSQLQSEGLREKIRQKEDAPARLPDAEARLSRALEGLEPLEESRQSNIARQGLLTGQLQRQEELTQAASSRQAQLTDAQKQQGIYQELAHAFGRQGVQAMLIETVVPRLEEEANDLLGRMTDNRMHVKLETQRERRSGSGDPIETLEIKVSDELGLRSYEMYSGGEAFRVNLALRIALSRVLSQRTGEVQSTLFIDEGFGTQDGSGRERIVDAISSIDDKFDMIIVITHLDDLKDMFPARIEVRKDDSGSTFWVS